MGSLSSNLSISSRCWRLTVLKSHENEEIYLNEINQKKGTQGIQNIMSQILRDIQGKP